LNLKVGTLIAIYVGKERFKKKFAANNRPELYIEKDLWEGNSEVTNRKMKGR
jgi:hypothetical protein